jgi:hypothetical protein
MLDELRVIFLFEADHLILGAGRAMAEYFIGFPTDRDEYCHFANRKEDLRKVDLTRFYIPASFSRGYDYAFRPSLTNRFDEHEVQDLLAFMDGVPQIGGVGSAGLKHQYMTLDGLCQTVADAVQARWKLEGGGSGFHLTTRELALLANMSEGAVRNAMADKTENGLRAIPGSKPVQFEHEEAERWLSNRRGFIATPSRPLEDVVHHEMIAAAKTAADLGLAIKKHSYTWEPHPDLVAAGFTEDALRPWLDGSFQFDAGMATRLAQALDLDVPLFVGKALEVSLRRDGGLA